MAAAGVSKKISEPAAHTAGKPGIRCLIAELRAFPIRIRRTSGSLVVTADLPGIRKDEVTVEASDTALMIDVAQGTDDAPVHEAGRRLIPLPDGVEVEMVKAELKKGLLTVWLPISYSSRTHRVPVEGDGDSPTVFGCL